MIFIFRKDFILWVICLCIMGIGIPIICIKKYCFHKKVRNIPKPNIIISKPQNVPPKCFEMKTIQSAVATGSINHQESEDPSTGSAMNILEFVAKPQENAEKMIFNNTKSNKNMINFGGIAILTAIFIAISCI